LPNPSVDRLGQRLRRVVLCRQRACLRGDSIIAGGQWGFGQKLGSLLGTQITRRTVVWFQPRKRKDRLKAVR